MLRLYVCATLLALSSVCGFGSNVVVNLSHYDEMNPDFARMKREGIVGVIHEATYPVYTADSAYGSRQDAALRAGLLWGAYHFAAATDPVQQADHFLKTVSRRWLQSPHTANNPGVLLVLDFEANGHYPGGTMRADQAIRFIERVRDRTGTYPGLYASENHLARMFNGAVLSSESKALLTRCWLWVANYHYEPVKLAPWKGWTLWQYTGDGVCDLPRSRFPISIANIRQAERNVFRGSADAACSFWQKRAWKPTP